MGKVGRGDGVANVDQRDWKRATRIDGFNFMVLNCCFLSFFDSVDFQFASPLLVWLVESGVCSSTVGFLMKRVVESCLPVFRQRQKGHSAEHVTAGHTTQMSSRAAVMLDSSMCV